MKILEETPLHICSFSRPVDVLRNIPEPGEISAQPKSVKPIFWS
jgi:hypothetical protein